MATAPVKPLHNFPLSLRWGTQPQPPYRPDSDSDLDPDLHSRHQQSTTVPPLLPPPPPPPRVGSRSARLHRFSFNSCLTSSSSIHKANKSHKPSPPKSQVMQEKPKPFGGGPEGEEEEENSFRPWKLRPRNKNGNHNNKNGIVPVEVKEPTYMVPVAPPAEPKSTRLRGIAESSGNMGGNGGGGLVSESKKEKRKFWIALSREEIEEDVFSMTGSRPARRPTKRPKNVQKLLDSVFPGLWLVGTTADSYRLAETPVRR